MKDPRFKKLMVNVILAVTTGVFLFSGEASAKKTSTISGRITDTITGAPVQGVHFYIVDASENYKTLEQLKQEYDNARNKNMAAGASGQLQTDAQGYYNFKIWDWRDTSQFTYRLKPFHSNYAGFNPTYTTFILGRVDRNYNFDFTVDNKPPKPNPMVWEKEPEEIYGGGGISDYRYTMVAVQATDESGIAQYFFECTTREGINSGWQSSRTYTVRVGKKDQNHKFRVKARDAFGNETAWSPAAGFPLRLIKYVTEVSGHVKDITNQPVDGVTIYFTDDTSDKSRYTYIAATYTHPTLGKGYYHFRLPECRESAIRYYLFPAESDKGTIILSDEPKMFELGGRNRNYTFDFHVTGVYDNKPPTPNPMVWEKEPTQVHLGTGTFDYGYTMTVVQAADESGYVQYFFECKDNGGFNSGWQSSREYTVEVGGQYLAYNFRVKAKDRYGNETAWSPAPPSLRLPAPGSSGIVYVTEVSGHIYTEPDLKRGITNQPVDGVTIYFTDDTSDKSRYTYIAATYTHPTLGKGYYHFRLPEWRESAIRYYLFPAESDKGTIILSDEPKMFELGGRNRNYTFDFHVSPVDASSTICATNGAEQLEYVIYPLAISNRAHPIAGFTTIPNPLQGDAPLTVEFTDKSTGYPTKWQWDFGDGQTGSGEKIIHKYEKPGRYTVKLTVTNPIGTDMKEGEIIALCPPPVADFTANKTEGIAPLEVTFKDESKGFPNEWIWDFGDGTKHNGQDPPLHTFALTQGETSRTYTVKLTVNNPRRLNRTDTKSMSITVYMAPPLIADFTVTPLKGDAPLTVQFKDLSTGDPTEREWDFGDKTYNSGLYPLENRIITHTYDKPDNYWVSFTVSDSKKSHTKADKITVTPIAQFSAEPTDVELGKPVQFTDGTISTGNIKNWSWGFGDGIVKSGKDLESQNPIHGYDKPGTYNVTLTVTTQTGISDTSDVKTITVKDTTPPRILITSPSDYSGDSDGIVEVKGFVPGDDLQSVEVKVDDAEWREAELIKEPGQYTFSCEVILPEPSDGEFSVITVKATDTSGNTSTHSINVIKGYVLLIEVPNYSSYNYRGLSSIAVAKDILDLIKPGCVENTIYIWYTGNTKIITDGEIHKHGLENNSLIDTTIDLWSNELDPKGMEAVLNHFQSDNNILTFEAVSYDNFDEFIKKIVVWLNWHPVSVQNFHIPIAVPQRSIGGSIRWILVTGFAVSNDPAGSDFTVYGLFFTEPDGGINTYAPLRKPYEYIMPMQPLPDEQDRYGIPCIPYETGYGETGYGGIDIEPLNNFDDIYKDKYVAVK
jgi:PKD repeat protein